MTAGNPAVFVNERGAFLSPHYLSIGVWRVGEKTF
jgi:hypothetical protein